MILAKLGLGENEEIQKAFEQELDSGIELKDLIIRSYYLIID